MQEMAGCMDILPVPGWYKQIFFKHLTLSAACLWNNRLWKTGIIPSHVVTAEIDDNLL